MAGIPLETAVYLHVVKYYPWLCEGRAPDVLQGAIRHAASGKAQQVRGHYGPHVSDSAVLSPGYEQPRIDLLGRAAANGGQGGPQAAAEDGRAGAQDYWDMQAEARNRPASFIALPEPGVPSQHNQATAQRGFDAPQGSGGRAVPSQPVDPFGFGPVNSSAATRVGPEH